MTAADDEFVSLAVWLNREACPPPPQAPPAVAETATPDRVQLDALQRELRLLRARLADVEDALATNA